MIDMFDKRGGSGAPGIGSFHKNVTLLGLVNALKTGNQLVDTLLAICIPYLISYAVQYVRRNHKHIFTAAFWRSFSLSDLWKRKYRRTIIHRSTLSDLGTPINLDDGTHNQSLIKAIKLYIHKHCDLDLDDADLELTDTENLTVQDNEDVNNVAAMVAGNPKARRHMKKLFGSPFAGLNNSDSDAPASTSTASMLRSCAVVKKPVQQTWHPIGTYGGCVVEIWMKEKSPNNEGSSKDSEGNGSKSIQKTEIRLRSTGKFAVDQFIDQAFSWYLSELKKLESDDRYLLDLRGFDGRAHHRSPVFSRFTLSDEKTFDSLFSKQCHSLLKIVDQFQTRTGKYSVPGYPYKLGVLLHGPPGTGKTSLIKALAHYTKRHIVSVPLSRLTTNQDLASMFYNNNYTIAGSSKRLALDASQVIFVLEDVDATSKVVMRRDLTASLSPAAAEILEKEKEYEDERLKVLDGTGEGIRQRGSHRKMKRHNRDRADGDSDASVAAVAAAAAASAVAAGSGAASARPSEEGNDDLNLTGLLNVLDGTIEMPGRLVVVTTNHPELLDPALIRPGRIDKHLKLGYICYEDAVSMIEHYYQTKLSDDEKERIKRVFDGTCTDDRLELVPAFVEQLSMEKDTVEELVASLEEKQVEQAKKKRAMEIISEDRPDTPVSEGSKSTESFDVVTAD